MEVKFIKYTKKKNSIHFTVDGQPTHLIVDTTPLIPVLKAHPSDGGLGNKVIEYINSAIGERVDIPYEGSIAFVPALLAAYANTIKLSGPMTKRRWQSILLIDRNARATYRGPNATIDLTHYVYRSGEDGEDRKDFVVVTTCRYQLTVTESGGVYVNMHGSVPADVDMVDAARQAYEFLNYVKSGHLWLPPLVSPESIYSSVDLITGIIEYRSGKETSQDSQHANEAREFGLLIRENFKLAVPTPPVKESKPDDVKMSVSDIFAAADKIRKHLPCEILRCNTAMKYGDLYYFAHPGLPYEGAENGIVVRLEMVTGGRSRHTVETFVKSPLAIFYNNYGVTTAVGKNIEVIDFTGMGEEQFERHLSRQCS